jgi:hypothetical protein
MPRENRRSGKLPTQDHGENGRSDMTQARRRGRSGFAVGRIFFKEVFVSHKLLPSILLACALLSFPAFAQPAAPPASSAADKAGALTP